MNKITKLISYWLSLLLIATVTISGTRAYVNMTADEFAEIHADERFEIELVQQQRSYDDNGNVYLEEFHNHKILIPLTCSTQYDGINYDQYGMPVADGYVDQIVRVKNTGTIDAYVRVVVGVPAVLDNTNALHWNLGNRFLADGSFSVEKTVNASFHDITWEYVETAEIDGVVCNLYVFTYQKSLPAGQITDAVAFVGFYLDKHVNIVNRHLIVNGMDTGFTDESVKIYVRAQGVQCTGFESAEQAFDMAQISTNPWQSQLETK